MIDLERHTIFRTLTGSRVYGTSTPTSDYDYRGVLIPPKEYFFGYKSHVEQVEVEGEDTVLYDIRKFLRLAVDNNPNVIELLYIPEKYWTVTTPYWRRLVAARHLFLSQKAYHTFRGYATAQMKRMQSHRGWLLMGELEKPTRSAFGLEEHPKYSGAADELIQLFLQKKDVELAFAEIAKVGAKAEAVALRQMLWEFLEQALELSKEEIEDKIQDGAAIRIGFGKEAMQRLQAEKAYRAARRRYESWTRWKEERNEKRREIERVAGYDAKHGMHLARLLLMCEDILFEGTIQVECRHAPFLRDIKEGRISYDDLIAWSKETEERLAVAKDKTTLPPSADRNAIEELGIELVEEFLRGGTDAYAPRD